MPKARNVRLGTTATTADMVVEASGARVVPGLAITGMLAAAMLAIA